MRGNILLMLAAFLWGTTFVAQMTGMDELGPFSYAAARYFLGLLSLIAVYFLFQKSRDAAKAKGEYRPGWRAGLCAGVIMFFGSSLQQVALQYTTAGKTSFITCLYIILVPLAATVFGRRITLQNWIGAVLAVSGLYFLAVKGDFTLGYGDLLVLIGAFFWTAHILYIDHFAALVDPIELSLAQIGLVCVVSFAAALMLETATPTQFVNSGVAIAYGGIMSAGVAFTLQIIGQRYTKPSHAAIIMSFEAIFGALSGWLLLGESMSAREIGGCLLMVTGMIITQVKL